jgi:hypothetical protein
MLKGKMLMWTSVAGVFLANAPLISVTPAGCKRVGYALEDTIFATAHATPDFGEVQPGDTCMRAMLACRTLADYENFCRRIEDATSHDYESEDRSNQR